MVIEAVPYYSIDTLNQAQELSLEGPTFRRSDLQSRAKSLIIRTESDL